MEVLACSVLQMATQHLRLQVLTSRQIVLVHHRQMMDLQLDSKVLRFVSQMHYPCSVQALVVLKRVVVIIAWHSLNCLSSCLRRVLAFLLSLA